MIQFAIRNIGVTRKKKSNNPFWNRRHTQVTRKQIGLSLKSYQKQNPQGLPIIFYKVKYPSIAQASRETKYARDTIMSWLKNPNKTYCLRLDPLC